MRHLMYCFAALLLMGGVISCQKEISQEQGAPARGSLQSSSGDCLPKLVSGSYMVNKALTDSNSIEVTVNVASAGSYTIATDTINGYSFKATGVFAATGATKVTLKGTGKPLTAGVNDFDVIFDTTTCVVQVTVVPAGTVQGPAAFTLVTAAGGTNCGSFTPFGNYVKDSTLNSTNYVTVQVNVTAVGTYSITTNTVNGYSFSATGTFGSATSPQTVTLKGTGKPIAAGTDNFTATAGTSTCTFPVTVTSTAPPPPSPCGITAAGTYTAGTPLTAANKIVLTHTYATAGTYTVSSNTVNGYSFGPLTYVASAGANTITVQGAGTPTAAGTDNFTVNYGDGSSCTFSVTVVAGAPPVVNTDYFPLTLNSYWTYDYDGDPMDTFKTVNNGPVTLGGTVLQRFIYNDGSTTDSTYFRKDNSTGYYYQSYDTTDFFGPGSGVVINGSPARVEFNFLRNTLTTNQTWNSDLNVTAQGTPLVVRIKYTCINAAASLTVNGKNFTNVYQIVAQQQLGQGGVFADQDQPLTSYYAKGVGTIKTSYGTGTNSYTTNIRFYQVN